MHGDTTCKYRGSTRTAFYQQIRRRARRGRSCATNESLDAVSAEEMRDRRMTGTIASYDFAPTPLSREHLLSENVDDADIVVTGNTVIDAFLPTAARSGSFRRPPRSGSELDPSRPIVVVNPRIDARDHPYRLLREDAKRCCEDCIAARAAANLLAGPSVTARRAGHSRRARRHAERRARLRPDPTTRG